MNTKPDGKVSIASCHPLKQGDGQQDQKLRNLAATVQMEIGALLAPISVRDWLPALRSNHSSKNRFSVISAVD